MWGGLLGRVSEKRALSSEARHAPLAAYAAPVVEEHTHTDNSEYESRLSLPPRGHYLGFHTKAYKIRADSTKNFLSPCPCGLASLATRLHGTRRGATGGIMTCHDTLSMVRSSDSSPWQHLVGDVRREGIST